MKATVIFVDDNQRCIDSMRRSLRDLEVCADWDMVFCSSPLEAMQAAPGRCVTALVTDEHMPEMSGHELIQAMKKLHPGIVPILITGDPDQDTAPGVILLEKPCSSDLIAEAIANAVRNTASGDTHA